MTIGERIAEIRKAAHLSQEAFGDSLGVTRQAISKWESDTSIPDVDKLVLISKTYDVSVGWILGSEEKDEAEEFSEKQIELVKEIVRQCSYEFEKHANEGPPPPPPVAPKKKSRKFLTFILIVAVVVFAVWCSNMSDRLLSLENSQGYLRSQISNVESTVANQTGILTSQIEEILNAQNSVLADFGYTIKGYDYAADTVDIEIYMVPKTYTDGMAAEFSAVSDGNSFTAVGTEGEGHRFKGTVTCKMSDNITLSVAITKDDIVETQLIDVIYDTRYMTLPVLYFASQTTLWGSTHFTDAAAIEETIIVNEDMYTEAYQKDITVTEVDLYLIINGEKKDKLTCEKATTDHGVINWTCNYKFEYKLANGDTIQYVAVATDNYGRRHLVYDMKYIVEDDFVDYDVSQKFDYTEEDIFGLLEE